jgi:N-acyl homoserine lactone hydrolase
MQVQMLNVGWISSPAMVWRQGEDPEAQLRFPIPAYLVETDTERILIDTGLNPEAVRDPQSHYGAQASFMAFEQERSVADQVDVSTLTRVVLTHLHFDHAGGLALLPPEVPIVVQRSEWEGGRDGDTIRRNFFYPRDYELDGRRIELVDGDHDLLGDGSIELLLTPGHTPGHQSVRLGEQLVIGADVTHFVATLDDLRFPSFADDFEAQARSAGRLRAMRKAGVSVMPGHDPDVLAPGPVAL